MKKRVMAVAAAIVMTVMLCACGSEPAPAQSSGTPAPAEVSVAASPTPSPSEVAATAEAKVLKDGTYEYIGTKDSDNEWYRVEGTMVVSNGVIQSMEWTIVDDNLHRVFDATYEEVFAGNDLYIQQSRDNWSGMQTYVPALIETQDPDQVDSVSGATWAYRKFEEAAKALLEQASQ